VQDSASAYGRKLAIFEALPGDSSTTRNRGTGLGLLIQQPGKLMGGTSAPTATRKGSVFSLTAAGIQTGNRNNCRAKPIAQNVLVVRR